MLDKDRILSKLDELDSYLVELESVMPKNYEEYVSSIEKKRSCERLLHILIECTIDVCMLMGELLPPFGRSFLLLRPDSIPHSPRAQVSFGETVSANHVWKVGYGGLDLHRRNFGLSHAYASGILEKREYKSFVGFHPQLSQGDFPPTK